MSGTGSLTTLAQAAGISAIIDTGTSGMGVVGSGLVSKLVAAGAVRGPAPQGVLYRFGSGSAASIGTLSLPWMGCRCKAQPEQWSVDIVKGGLPFLLGGEFLRQYHLDVQVRDQQLKCGGCGETFPLTGVGHGALLCLDWTSVGKHCMLNQGDAPGESDASTVDENPGDIDPLSDNGYWTDEGEDEGDDANAGLPIVDGAVAAAVPSAFKLTPKQLQRVHQQGHLPRNRMLAYLLSTVKVGHPRDAAYHKQVKELRIRISKVCSACRPCLDRVQRKRPGGRPRVRGERGGRVLLDTVCLSDAQNLWSLTCVDTETGLVTFARLPAHDGPAVAETFIRCWVAKEGLPTGLVVSDLGRQFVSGEFLAACESLGISKQCSFGFEPEGHGAVERANRVLRWSIDRMRDDPRKPSTGPEWDYWLAVAENSARNTILVGGYSAAQRAYGRSTGMSLTVMSDTLCSGQESDTQHVARLQEISDSATSTYLQVINSRTLRRMLVERARPVQREYLPGEAVSYWRPPTAVRGPTWRGPATVLGKLPGGGYLLDHGGLSVRASGIRGWCEDGYAGGQPMQLVRVVDPMADGDDDPAVPVVLPEELAEMPVVAPPAPAQAQPAIEDERPRPPLAEVDSVEVEQRPPDRVWEVVPMAQPAVMPAGLNAIPLPIPRNAQRVIPTIAKKCHRCIHGYSTKTHRTHAAGCPNRPAARHQEHRRDVHVRHAAVSVPSVPAVKLSVPCPLQHAPPLPAEAVQQDAATPRASRTVERFELASPGSPVASPRPRLESPPESPRVEEETDEVDNLDRFRHWFELNYDRFVTTEGMQRAMRRSAFPATFEKSETCLAGMSELDGYAYSWADLTPQQQLDAKLAGIADYETWGCWGKETFSVGQTRHAHPDATVFHGHWVKKAQVKEGALKGKARWTPHGFEEHVEDPASVESPTASAVSHRVLDAVALTLKWESRTLDVKQGFFQGELLPADGKELFVILPPELQPPGAKGSTMRCRRLLKEVPGTKGAPRSFYDRMHNVLTNNRKLSMLRSKVDNCVWMAFDAKGVCTGWIALHVDDGRVRGTKDWLAKFEKLMPEDLVLGKMTPDQTVDFTGKQLVETAAGLYSSQEKYIQECVKEVPLDKARARQPWLEASPSELHSFRSCLGSVSWTAQTRGEFGYELSQAASAVSDLRVQHILDLNKVVRYVLQTKSYSHFLPRLEGDLKVVIICDASEPTEARKRAHGGYVICLASEETDGLGAPLACVLWKSKTVRRVATSAFDAETLAAHEALDAGVSVGMLLEEIRRGPKPSLYERQLLEREGKPYLDEPPKMELYTDSNGLVTRVHSMKDSDPLSRRRRTDISDFKELLAIGHLASVTHIPGVVNPTDVLTKEKSPHCVVHQLLRQLLYEGRMSWEEAVGRLDRTVLRKPAVESFLATVLL